MKKLMIATAIVCAAAMSQAASVSWKSGTSIKGPGADGTFNQTTLAKETWNMYVWTINADTYNDLDIAKIYENYSGKTGEATKGVWGSSASTGVTTTTTAGDGVDVYGVILMTYTDGDNKEWYIANKATATTDAMGGGASIGNLAKNVGGTGGTAITGWTAAAVPEPTSGLLLLLGVAGLALRRRRA